MTTSVQKRDERNTLEEILKRPAYAERFKQVLGEKASQFCSSLVSIGRSMPDVEPKSIVGSAMVAACLDLPIEKNLGFAWIVPFKKDGVKVAQFQLGFKGYIQLAQRTGYYAGMNACTVNEEAYKGRDSLGEPIIDWNLVDETKPAVGYFFGFRMINGFTKGAYWTKKKVLDHAQKYSQSFRGGYDSPWKTHFDKMAIKTVIANELSDWGILSVQFQLARKNDQAVIKDIDAEAEYLDNGDGPDQIEDAHKPEATGHQKATGKAATTTTEVKAEVKPADKAPEPKTTAVTPLKETGLGLGDDNVSFDDQKPQEGSTKPQDSPVATQTPKTVETPAGDPAAATEPGESAAETSSQDAQAAADPAWAPKPEDTDELASVKVVARNACITYEGVMKFLRHKRLARDDQKLSELSSKKLLDISKRLSEWAPEIKGQK